MTVENTVVAYGDAKRLSWGSVIAGVFTAVAVSLVMAALGVALGFTVLEPTSSEPFSGLGVSFDIWAIVSVIVSLGAGGLMAGYFAVFKGCEHGFLTWAVVLLVASFFSTMAIGSAVTLVGSAIKTVGSGAADMASGVGGGLKNLASSAIDGIQDNVDLNIDSGDLKGEVVSVLQDTGIETLQPDYLNAQMRGARSDLRQALDKIRMNRADSKTVITDFVNKQKDRLDRIGQGIDRESAVQAVIRNSDMSRSEAEEAVDNALAAWRKAGETARNALEEAGMQLEDAQLYLEQLEEQARVKAEEFADAAAKAALAAAVALIIGAVVSSLGGYLGGRLALRRYPAGYPV